MLFVVIKINWVVFGMKRVTTKSVFPLIYLAFWFLRKFKYVSFFRFFIKNEYFSVISKLTCYTIIWLNFIIMSFLSYFLCLNMNYWVAQIIRCTNNCIYHLLYQKEMEMEALWRKIWVINPFFVRCFQSFWEWIVLTFKDIYVKEYA